MSATNGRRRANRHRRNHGGNQSSQPITTLAQAPRQIVPVNLVARGLSDRSIERFVGLLEEAGYTRVCVTEGPAPPPALYVHWAGSSQPSQKTLVLLRDLARLSYFMPAGAPLRAGKLTVWRTNPTGSRQAPQRGRLVLLGERWYVTAVAGCFAFTANGNYWVTQHLPTARNVLALGKTFSFNDHLLIEGETGTGKTSLARIIHSAVSQGGQLVAVTGRELTGDVAHGELFGHVRGAFTDAVSDREGKLVLARGGTFLIDEVDMVPEGAQPAIYEFVRTRQFFPLGGDRAVSVPCTVIATANRPVLDLVQSHEFLAELYLTLGYHMLVLPPFSWRPEDLMAHVVAQVQCAAVANRRPLYRFHPTALTAIGCQRLPGNFRQLRRLASNIVHRVGNAKVVTGRHVEEAGQDALVDDVLTAVRFAGSLSEFLDEMLALVAARRLRVFGGNVSAAAADLGVSRCTLYRWLARRRDKEVVGRISDKQGFLFPPPMNGMDEAERRKLEALDLLYVLPPEAPGDDNARPTDSKPPENGSKPLRAKRSSRTPGRGAGRRKRAKMPRRRAEG